MSCSSQNQPLMFNFQQIRIVQGSNSTCEAIPFNVVHVCRHKYTVIGIPFLQKPPWQQYRFICALANRSSSVNEDMQIFIIVKIHYKN